MRVYEQINALPPAGIGKKSAHIIAGGIGGLPAAAFLVDDAHMRTGSRCMSRSGSSTPHRTLRRKKAKLPRRIEINKYSGLPSLRGRDLVAH
jgi:hypothetical protein